MSDRRWTQRFSSGERSNSTSNDGYLGKKYETGKYYNDYIFTQLKNHAGKNITEYKSYGQKHNFPELNAWYICGNLQTYPFLIIDEITANKCNQLSE